MEKLECRFPSPTYFATSMPSCGFCDCDRYDNNSMVRGKGVLWREKDGGEAEIKGGGGGVQ